MKIALLGLPNAGKTTIFNTLTRSEAEVTSYSNAKAEPNLAVVEVGDERVTRLAEMYHPKKTTYATIDLMDFSGFTEGSARKGLFPPELMQLVRNAHALAVVLRNFEDDPGGSPDPVRDFHQIHEELLLSDLMIAEPRLERIRHGFKRGIKSKNHRAGREGHGEDRELAQRKRSGPELELSPDDEKAVRGYQFLARKPLLVILNSDESGFGKNEGVIAELEKSGRVIEFAGHFEMELSRMEDDESALFMEDMGIRESARYLA